MVDLRLWTAFAGILMTSSAGGSDAWPAHQVVPADVLQLALHSARCAEAKGELEAGPASHLLTVIDYSKPSTERRMWVLDRRDGSVLFREHVAHGQGTGELLARRFSNVEGSHQSSLGLFRTAETYHGKHGLSLRLDGLERGINDHARERAIVVHGADYATEDFIGKHGRLGRSWGCPALDDEVAKDVITTIAGGSLLFAYYPDEHWLTSSDYLRCEG